MLPWNWTIFMGDLPILKFKSWLIFTGNLPFSIFKKNFSKCLYFSEIDLLSQATYHFQTLASVHASLKLIYFLGWPTLFKFQKEFQQTFILPWNWSIFTGNLPILKFKNYFIFTGDLAILKFKNNFNKRPWFPEVSLFSRATCLFWNSN